MFSLGETVVNSCLNPENNFQDGQMPQCDDGHHSTINNKMDVSDGNALRNKTDLSNLKVTVGIDEDLQMILEMDPSIVDLVRNFALMFFFAFATPF